MNSKQFSGIYQAVLLSCSALFCVTALAQTSNTAEFQAPRASQNAASPSSTAQDPALREVIVQGYGRDVPDAAQNAAQNALTQIVGSFIDSKTVLEKRVEIQDGVRSETKDIRTDIKEYSQGSIKSFELLDVKQQQNLVQLTARVVVRVEDFRMLVKSIAEASIAVSPGLFATIQQERKQSDNLADILYSNILSPYDSTSNLDISIDRIIAPQELAKIKSTALYIDMGNVDNFFKRHERSIIIGLKLTASIKPTFWAEANKILTNIAADTKKFSVDHRDMHQSWASRVHSNGAISIQRISPNINDDRNRISISVVRPKPNFDFILLKHLNSYLVPSQHLIGDLPYNQNNPTSGLSVDVDQYLISSDNIVRALDDLANKAGAADINSSELLIDFLNAAGSSIHTEQISSSANGMGKIVSPEISHAQAFRRKTSPWKMTLGFSRPSQIILLPKRTFYLFIATDEDILRNTKSIRARINSR